jgi:hypothetical protein
MLPIELKKLKLELMKVQSAKYELELRIDESNEQIQRLKEHIKIQEKRENELIDLISNEENKQQK